MLTNQQSKHLLQDISVTDLYVEAFKRGIFDFITVTDKGKHEKQDEALRILTDNETDELLYGGAAGGAKSWTGCAWLIFMCLLYPGTRWFIGREEIKRITSSTLLTFYKVASMYGITSFRFNANKNYIQFTNGSRIDLLDLIYKPGDPLYERFGSEEYTGGWIEEGGETNFGAYDIMKSRIGRQLNEKYGLRGKLLITCNPKKNWLHRVFYVPHTKGELPKGMRYLVAMVQDNPHVDDGYIDRLRNISDPGQLARLFRGEWDYDDDPNAMIDYTHISAIFTNRHVIKTGIKYLVADVARYGSDKARICVFDGWVLIEHICFDISATTLIQDCINAMRSKHGIPAHQCIADDDGVGGGVVDNCQIIGFVNNSKPVPVPEAKDNPLNRMMAERYENLQTQCAYLFADQVQADGFYIEADLTGADMERISTELAWLKTYKSDESKVLRIMPKNIVKENIGTSPDWRDVFIMRKYFDIAQHVIARPKWRF